MVDTEAELSWLPKQLLLDAGITPKGKRRFATATNHMNPNLYLPPWFVK
jgi:hypothetical protein